MRAWLASFFKIRKRERDRVFLMALLSMLFTAATIVVGRTVATALFLDRIDKVWLPLTFVASAAGTGVAAAVYARFSNVFRRDKIFAGTSALSAVVIFVFPVALGRGHGEHVLSLGLLYVLVEIIACVGLLQFWALARKVFPSQDAKRVFGFIAGGASVAVIGFGGIVGTAVWWMGVPNLLYFMSALLLASSGVAIAVGRICEAELKEPPVAEEAAAAEGFFADVKYMWKEPYLVNLAAIIILTSLATGLIDYQWKVSAQTAYLGNAEALVRYFALFHVVTGTIGLLIQFFLQGRILSSFGVGFALILLPGVLLATSLGVLTTSAQRGVFWAVGAARGSDTTLRFGLYKSSMQILYHPIAPAFEARAAAILDGVLKQVASAAVALAIMALVLFMDETQLSYVVIAITVVWMVAARRLNGGYEEMLTESIRGRRFDLRGRLPVDGATKRALERALQADDLRNTYNALELLSDLPSDDWDALVIPLLRSRHAGVRARSLTHLGREGNHAAAQAVELCLQDSDPEVEAAAVRALCGILGAEAIPKVRHLLSDDDFEVSAAAAAGILLAGEFDGSEIAKNELKRMCESTVPAHRCTGAGVLGMIGTDHFRQELIELLADPAPEVRSAAAVAAESAKSPVLIPALILLLSEVAQSRAASSALVAHGEWAIEPLGSKLIGESDAERAGRLAIPSVLQRIGGQRALDVLISALDSDDSALRGSVLRAVHQLVSQCRFLHLDAAIADGLLQSEYKSAVQDLVMVAEIDPAPASLLHRVLEDRLQQGADRVLRAVGIVSPDAPIESIVERINSKERHTRSNAVELLGTRLDYPLRSNILALFNDASWTERAEACRDTVEGLAHHGRQTWLRLLSETADGWLSACASDALEESENIAMVQINQLVGLAPFQELGGDSLQSLVQIATEVNVAANEALIGEGPNGEWVYLVMDGAFRVYTADRELTLLGPGDLVGEVSVLDDDLGAATVEAVDSARVLRMEHDAFYDMITSRPEVGLAVVRSLTRRLRKAIEENRSN